MNRSNPTQPIAAVGAVVVHRDRVLLVKRDRPPNQGLWTLPGGGIELGETATQAICRELLEECHINIVVDRVLDVVDIIHKDEQGRIEFHYVILEFLARYQSGTLTPDSDVADAQWMRPGQLDDFGVNVSAKRLIGMALLPNNA